MKFATKRGFAIWEILVVIVVISVGILSVVVVLTNGMKYVQKTRQKIVALNLAREGMEAVYQIRDTNWTRWAGVKDQCWLKINPLADEGGQRCIDDPWLSTGRYVLQRLITGEQTYFSLTGPFLTGIDFSDGLDTGDYVFSLCQQNGMRHSCMGNQHYTNEGRYFREIQGLGLYLKDVTMTGGLLVVCTGGLGPDIECGTHRAKEFRFCSRVVYVGDGTGDVVLCGVLTNFKEK